MPGRHGDHFGGVVNISGYLVDNGIAFAGIECFNESRVTADDAARAITRAEIGATRPGNTAFAFWRYDEIGAALLADRLAIEDDDAVLHGDAVTGQTDNALDEVGAIVARCRRAPAGLQ